MDHVAMQVGKDLHSDSVVYNLSSHCAVPLRVHAKILHTYGNTRICMDMPSFCSLLARHDLGACQTFVVESLSPDKQQM